jgi:hypothetical protein
MQYLLKFKDIHDYVDNFIYIYIYFDIVVFKIYILIKKLKIFDILNHIDTIYIL